MSATGFLEDVQTAEVQVTRRADVITLSIATQFTERVDLTPEQATVLGFTLLAHAGRSH